MQNRTMAPTGPIGGRDQTGSCGIGWGAFVRVLRVARRRRSPRNASQTAHNSRGCVEREGIDYRIGMKVPGARVTHVLRMPTAKEMQDHERASTSVIAARRSVETRAFLEPSGALYDKVHVSHDGYAGAVPIVHKSAAVSEVIGYLAIEGDDDPE